MVVITNPIVLDEEILGFPISFLHCAIFMFHVEVGVGRRDFLCFMSKLVLDEGILGFPISLLYTSVSNQIDSFSVEKWQPLRCSGSSVSQKLTLFNHQKIGFSDSQTGSKDENVFDPQRNKNNFLYFSTIP